MSADNYVAVKQGEDGHWYVWMVLGGYDEGDWEVPEKPYHKTPDKLDALEWAHKYCVENVVEYGVRLLSQREK